MRWQPMPHPDKAPESYLVADISSNNGTFNASEYSSAGHLLITIKATQGANYVNPQWVRWAEQAHGARLAVMHYHFVDGSGAYSEANHFWATVEHQFNRKTDRLMIDWESAGALEHGPAYLAELDRQITRLSGVRSIGYTFKSELSSELRVQSGKWLVASFGSAWPAGAFRRLPNGTMWGWQFTDGKLGAPGPRAAAGIGSCDLSVIAPPIVDLLRKSLKR